MSHTGWALRGTSPTAPAPAAHAFVVGTRRAADAAVLLTAMEDVPAEATNPDEPVQEVKMGHEVPVEHRE